MAAIVSPPPARRRKLRAAGVPPAAVAAAVTEISEGVQAFGRALLPASASLMSMTVGYQVTSRAISAAAELDLADHLAARPCTIEELATATRSDAAALSRLVRLLQTAGLVKTRRDGRIHLTRRGGPLRSDHPQSLRDWCRYLAADWHWELWADLDCAVRDGRTAYAHRFATGFFEWFAERPAEARVFDDAMTSFSALVDAPIAAACDLSGVDTVIDIAGGNGALLAALLRRHPALRGILFDLPDVVERAREPGRPLTSASVAPRAAFAAGNMFETVPEGHDAYLLKWILHDWPDEVGARVLERIAAATRPGARLLVAEMLLAQGRTANPARQLDLAMLLLTGGRERTASELQELVGRAGFEPRGVARTASPMHVLSFVRR